MTLHVVIDAWKHQISQHKYIKIRSSSMLLTQMSMYEIFPAGTFPVGLFPGQAVQLPPQCGQPAARLSLVKET